MMPGTVPYTLQQVIEAITDRLCFRLSKIDETVMMSGITVGTVIFCSKCS
jgi:hypothetical protein